MLDDHCKLWAGLARQPIDLLQTCSGSEARTPWSDPLELDSPGFIVGCRAGLLAF